MQLEGLPIRASMLPGIDNCEMNAIVRQFPEMVELAGNSLRRPRPHIGGIAGSGFHAAAEHVLIHRMEDGALEAAREVILKEIDGAPDKQIEWDLATKRVDDALAWVDRAIKKWIPVAETYVPEQVEAYFEMPLGDGFKFTGHLDVRTVFGVIIDHKSGQHIPHPMPQIGGYAKLAEHAGLAVTGGEMHYVARVPLTRTQPEVFIERYHIPTAIRMADIAIDRIKEVVNKFMRTGDPLTFRMNPSALICSKKFCPVWGTSFCNQWRDTGDD